MRSSLVSAVVALAVVATSASVATASVAQAGLTLRSHGSHRRHHHSHAVRRSSSPSKTRNKRSSKCKASSSSSSSTVSSGSSNSTSTSSDDDSSSSNSTASSNSTSSSSSISLSSDFLTKNGLYWGYLPDEADAGGTKQTMAEINEWTSSKSAFYGYYSQAKSGTTFDGSQLLSVMDDVKSSGAIFQPAVMPTGGWQGLTSSDNSQAVAIAKVMKQFTDEGIEVWLRLAHEMNWYQQDGTYTGGVSDFKAAWQAVSAALSEYAPDVKMFFTPNVENMSAYEKYWPCDASASSSSCRVDVIGIDYYPSSSGQFVSTMQAFHDKYTSDTIKFAIGETGWGKSADIATRLAYVEEITSDATKAALPNFVGASWFNFMKGYDFRIVTGDDSTTKQTVSFFSA